MDKVYFAIDLKSFYASVECVERGLDPLTTNLVVADISRTDKTICLAVSPSLKKYGIPGRARLFEVRQALKKINYDRKKKINNKAFKGKSYFEKELDENPYLELDMLIATPQMNHYMRKSAEIYQVYLEFVSSEDIHVYSIDEVFIDVSSYLQMYKLTPNQLAKKIISRIYEKTGIVATGGIGTNLYLAKVAMDIVAKHIDADEDGVRIAYLDERKYRELLWNHKPLKDFWRVGSGYVKRLSKYNLYTMGDIARLSLSNEDLLYEEFGINAELLIDHAWGYESCEMKDIKNYVPDNNSLSSGQVLDAPYDYEKGELIVKEMADVLALDLTKKHLMTDQISLAIGYDVIDLEDYQGELKTDYIGREMPKGGHGSLNLNRFTNSSKILRDAFTKLYRKIMNKSLHMRRAYVVATHVVDEELVGKNTKEFEQLNLFTDFEEIERVRKIEDQKEVEDHEVQLTLLKIQDKFGKNAAIRGMNKLEGAKTTSRNEQVGGHKA